ncbi:MAG: hypothetical protein AAF599_01605 [Bacteroidota bacterium]
MAKRKSKNVVVSDTFLISAAVGGAATVAANRVLENVSFIQDSPQADLIIAGVEGAAGYYLATQTRGEMTRGAGIGMIGAAGLKLLEASGLTTANTGGGETVNAVYNLNSRSTRRVARRI